MVVISLAVDDNSVWPAPERYDAYVSYDQIDACNQYVWFMECVVERIDNAEVRRIYKNNIYTTVRNWAEFDWNDELSEICDDSLQSLWSETILHKYWCTIESNDVAIRNLVLPDALKEVVSVPEEETELATWALAEEIDEALTWDIALSTWINNEEILDNEVKQEQPETEREPGVIEIITVGSGTWIDLELEKQGEEEAKKEALIAYTRVQVLQNRVWFLRIRERATTNSFEIGRLWIGNVVDVVGQEGTRYLIRYWNESLGWVSGKYVRNIGLPVEEAVLEVQWETISLE